MTYYKKLKDKITNKTSFALDGRTFNAAMGAMEKNAGYREKTILEDVESIFIVEHAYPDNRYITATVYNHDGEGFEFMIKHEADRPNHKPGDITG